MNWINYNSEKPEVGVEVLAFSPDWKTYCNPTGVRIGFLNEDEDGPFISAAWDNNQDFYETDDSSVPALWMPIKLNQ